MRQLFSVLSIAITLTSILILSCGDKKSKEPLAIYTVDALTNKAYTIEATGLPKAENPILILKRGEIYKFIIKTYDHPFYIKTEQVSGKEKAYDKGVTNNGAKDDVLLFEVPGDAPDLLYYVCKFHKMMSGELQIVD